MSQGTTPPGWYDDGQGAERWWDGVRWTEQTRPGPQPALTPQPPQPPYGAPQQSGRGKGPLIAAVAGAVALLTVGVVVLVVVLGGDDGGDDDRADDPTSSATTATSEPTTATSPASPTYEPTSEAPTEPEPSEPSEPGPAPAGSASATVQDFFDTVQGGNCDAVDFLSNKAIGVTEAERADALAAAKAGCGEGGFFGDQDIAGCTFDLGQETGDDRAAEVAYDVTECDDASNNESGSFRLVVESGEWRIDDFQSS